MNKLNTLGAVALSMVLAMAFVACDDNGNSSSSNNGSNNDSNGGGGGGATVNGSLAAGDDQPLGDGSYGDTYALTGASGGTTITMTSDSFDCFLLLLNADGSQVLMQNADSGGGTTDSRMTFQAQAGTAYTVIARSNYPDTTGAYTLTTTSGTLTAK